MLEIRLYLSNLKTYEDVVYLSMKYKYWSTKWDVHFEHKSINSNANSRSIWHSFYKTSRQAWINVVNSPALHWCCLAIQQSWIPHHFYQAVWQEFRRIQLGPEFPLLWPKRFQPNASDFCRNSNWGKWLRVHWPMWWWGLGLKNRARGLQWSDEKYIYVSCNNLSTLWFLDTNNV